MLNFEFFKKLKLWFFQYHSQEPTTFYLGMQSFTINWGKEKDILLIQW